MSITTSAMIVTLNVSCWTARKQDKQVTAEVDKIHNAKDAGRYNKLLVDKAHLDPLLSHAGKIRNEHYKLTLPWMDNGGRLLPSKLFLDWRDALDKLRSEYDDLIDTFISRYESELVPGARARLGTMYNPEDYPPSSELRRKFSVDFDIMPVPSGNDFRVEIDETERQRIQDEISDRLEQRQKEAMAAAWDRVRECVSTIYDRTSAEKPRIHNSLMDNAQELVRLLPGLNVANDPALTAITEAIAQRLIVNTMSLRDSAINRKVIAKHAQEILARIPKEL